jgi:hypothetical protein
LTKKKEIGKRLDYISRQLGTLEIVERLPNAGLRTEALINRAMDILSASLNYLSDSLLQERMGILGKLYLKLVAKFARGHDISVLYWRRRLCVCGLRPKIGCRGIQFRPHALRTRSRVQSF